MKAKGKSKIRTKSEQKFKQNKTKNGFCGVTVDEKTGASGADEKARRKQRNRRFIFLKLGMKNRPFIFLKTQNKKQIVIFIDFLRPSANF